jgi:hypothetical protein
MTQPLPYATLRPPKPKGRRTKKGVLDTRGRPPAKDQVRIVSLGRDYQRVRIAFSEDILERLIEMYEYDFDQFVFGRGAMSDRYKVLRMQFAPFVNLAIPAVLMRIEPPTYDPFGSRIRRTPRGRQFIVEILAAKIRVKDGIQSQNLEHYLADLPGKNQLRGVVLQFHDDDMIFPGPKTRGDKYELNANDLIVKRNLVKP